MKVNSQGLLEPTDFVEKAAITYANNRLGEFSWQTEAGMPELPKKALALKVLQRFSWTMLCMAERGQRYGPSGKPRPGEAAYLDEFHRFFAEEVGPGVCTPRVGYRCYWGMAL